MTGDASTPESRPRVAAFRPAGRRATDAEATLRSLGAEPVIDPMVTHQSTGEVPRTDSAYVIFTSVTGANMLEHWSPSPEQTVCAIGETTATALADVGIEVGIIPGEFSSHGLVSTLATQVDGERVEIARSNHGSNVLIDGLIDAGAYVHETVLYEIIRPPNAGRSVELAAKGSLDAALFTSPLTVEHFIEAAVDLEIEAEVRHALDDICVAVIGKPTADHAQSLDVTVDLIADQADFERLATQAIDQVSAASGGLKSNQIQHSDDE